MLAVIVSAVHWIDVMEMAAAAALHQNEILQQISYFTLTLSKGWLTLRPLKGLSSLNK